MNYKVAELAGVPVVVSRDSEGRDPPTCADLDDECPLVVDKVVCWLYAPEEGVCPYLQRETP